MKKVLNYTLKGVVICAAILAVVYSAAYFYILANKKNIIRQIKEQVADKLNGEVQIGDIDLGFLANFPGIAVELDKVSIRDTMFNQHKHPFFQAEKVYGSLSIINLIKRDNPLIGISVEKGQMYVFTDTSGYTNSYLFLPKSDSAKAKKTSAAKTEIEEIKLRDVRLTLDDRRKRKLFDFDVSRFSCVISTRDSLLTIKTKNNILIHSLAFNTAMGSFAKEARFEGNFKVVFNKSQKSLRFNDIDIILKDHPFTLSGNFNFSPLPTFSIKVSTKNIDYTFARNLLAAKTSTALSIVKVEKPIDEVNAEISGPLNGGEPLVNAQWKLNQNNAQSPFANFADLSCNGSFTNELVVGKPRLDENSRIQLRDFTGIWQGLKVNSKTINVDNLTIPVVNADIKTDFNLTQLNNLVGSTTLDLHDGQGSLDITYSGPLQANTSKNSFLNGKFTFSNGILMYHPRNMPLTNVSGNVVFKNSDVFVNDFQSTIQGNKIVMNGSGKNLLSLLETSPGKIFIDWNIYSPSLNLGSFTSLLKDRPSPMKGKSATSKLGSNLDQIVEQANFRLKVKADQLTFKRFTASNVNASLGLTNQNWLLNNISLQHGGGSMVVSGSLNEKNNDFYNANIKVNMENVDVNKVMYAFDNFGQNGISSDNLRGKLTSSADIQMDIDRNLGSPSNINGFVDFSLKKGALLHYDPIKKIQNIALKNRNFDEIYFAELKDRFDIKDRDITINRMEIESTVMTLFVEGVYSLRGNTDISIQVPLSNLRKKDEDAKLENKGAEAKGGASVYLRGQPGSDGNIKFKIDLFKKFRKKDK